MLHVTICSKYICTILVLFSTLCDVMMFNRGYSENGTNVKANRIHLMTSELLAEIKSIVLLYNINSERQHIMQVIIEILQ